MTTAIRFRPGVWLVRTLVVLASIAAAVSTNAATLEIVTLNSPVVEGASDAEVAVRLTLELNDSPADCRIDGVVASVDGSASAGSDYQAINAPLSLALTATANTVEQRFTIPIIDDVTAEPDESFDVRLGVSVDPVACPLRVSVLGTTSVSITDPDAAVVGPPIVIRANPGETASSSFSVTGVPPIALTAQIGNVSPAVLSAPGDATYTFDVPANAPAGSVFNDTITVADEGGTVTTQQVTILVANALTEISSLTPNQRSLAAWFDSACPRLAQGASSPDAQDLVLVCDGLKDPANSAVQIVAALDAINGEELIGAADDVLRLIAQQRGNLSQRLSTLRSGASGIDLTGLNLEVAGQQIAGTVLQEILNAMTGGAASADDFGRWGLFIDGRANFGDKSRTEDQAGFDFDTVGATVGVDYRLNDHSIIGGSLDYARLDANYDHSGGSLSVDSWNGSLFASYFVADSFYVDAMLSYGNSRYESDRHIVYADAGGHVNRRAKGDTDGAQWSAGISSGFDINTGPWTFGPHLGSYHAGVDADEFSEQGAAGLNLTVGDQSAKSFTVNAGVHASRVFTPAWGVLIPNLRFDLVHELKDGRERVVVGFAADPFSTDPLDPTPDIVLQTDRPDRDYVVWSAGVSAQFINGISGFANYQGTAAYGDLTLAELTLGMRWERSF
jgi:outer membrane autotransporter protein